MDLSGAGLQKTLRSFWDKLSTAQKIITVIAPLVVAGALLSLIFWASKPEYVQIFTKLNEADAGAVTEELKSLRVDYQLADNGSTILVPKQVAAETRLQLANAGLPQQSKFSFANLDQMRIGETEADRRLRYVLGLQNELEITLRTLAGVSDARVHIVMPEESLFQEREKIATAAVTIQRVPGAKITEAQIRGISNLISASVEGLQPENVTIVDTDGNIYETVAKNGSLENLTGTQIQYQDQIEDKIEKSIQSMLDRVYGYGMTVVRVNASLDFDQIKIIEQKKGPGALVSKQTTQETSSSGSTGGAVPGTQSNVPVYESTSGSNSSSEKATSIENWEVDTTQIERLVSPGTIKRLSLSVMVNSDGAPQGAEGEAKVQNQIESIRMIVASAAGIDETRGDQIQVAAMPFYKTTLNGQGELSQYPILTNADWMKYLPLGGAILFAFLILALVLRTRSKRRRAKIEEQEAQLPPMTVGKAEEYLLAQQKAEEEANLRLAQKNIKTAEEIERQKIKEAVEKYSKNNPDEVARLIKTWLAEER